MQPHADGDARRQGVQPRAAHEIARHLSRDERIVVEPEQRVGEEVHRLDYARRMDPSPDNRFARHLSLGPVGAAGQAKLGAAHVLIVGLGGLGSPAALYLAAAGLGRLTFADFDVVEVSNLQRQIAHTTDRVGRAKTASAREACLALHPDARIDCVEHALDEDDLAELVPTADVVLDCSDNFATRHAVNAACVAAGVAVGDGRGHRLRRSAHGRGPETARQPVLAMRLRQTRHG